MHELSAHERAALVELVNDALLEDWLSTKAGDNARDNVPSIALRYPQGEAELSAHGSGLSVPHWNGQQGALTIPTLRAILHKMHNQYVIRQWAMQMDSIYNRALCVLTPHEIEILRKPQKYP